ncbi:MAG: hypothetical protein SOW25_07650 [Helicobacter sp.]|nr:hypothetical protein [Helicobacter sp.]
MTDGGYCVHCDSVLTCHFERQRKIPFRYFASAQYDKKGGFASLAMIIKRADSLHKIISPFLTIEKL